MQFPQTEEYDQHRERPYQVSNGSKEALHGRFWSHFTLLLTQIEQPLLRGTPTMAVYLPVNIFT